MTWLIGSRLGRWALAAGVAMVALLLIVRAIYRRGKNAAEEEALQARADALLQTVETIRRMSDAQAAAPRTRDAVLDRLRRGDA